MTQIRLTVAGAILLLGGLALGVELLVSWLFQRQDRGPHPRQVVPQLASDDLRQRIGIVGGSAPARNRTCGFPPPSPGSSRPRCRGAGGRSRSPGSTPRPGWPQRRRNARGRKELAKGLNLDPASFEQCLNDGAAKARVAQDVEAGTRAGVTGTPTFFINGRPLVGAQPFDSLKSVIEQELPALRK